MAKYESNLTQKEKDDIAAKSRKATRSKFSKLKEFFTTKKRYTPAISERAKKIKQAQADVEKDLPRGKPAPSQMEDYKPQSFGQAFKSARLQGLDTFLFDANKDGKIDKDKERFSTATAEDVKKSGSTSLREYLNKKLADEEDE